MEISRSVFGFADSPRSEDDLPFADHSIYRTSPGPHIPLGDISDVSVERTDEGVLQINLWIEGAALALRAGEVIEHSSDAFAICDFAGSTLVYLDTADVSSTRFGEVMSWR